jgi:hypothetical protein
MATQSAKIDEHPISLHTGKIVCRLDLFPKLLQALREGDLLTGRLFCAQLFNCDGRRNRMSEVNTHQASRDEGSLRTFPPFV